MHSIEFSADGKKIVTTSEDGVVLLYDIIFIDDFLKSDHLAPLTKEQKEKYGIEEESWVSKLINKIFSD
jgi:WD40 repeat protein